MAHDTMSFPQGHQPLPQWCHNRTGLQLATSLPCPAMALPRQTHPWAQVPAQPKLVLVYREVSDAQGWEYPNAPQLPCSWLGRWDRPWLPGLAIIHHGTPQGAAALLSAPTGGSGRVYIPRAKLKWGSGPRAGVRWGLRTGQTGTRKVGIFLRSLTKPTWKHQLPKQDAKSWMLWILTLFLPVVTLLCLKLLTSPSMSFRMHLVFFCSSKILSRE